MHGAIPSAGLLGIAGLKWDGKTLTVVHEAIIAIAGDDQQNYLTFADEISAYLRAHDVKQLLIQRPPFAGPHAGSHFNQKSEAALWSNRQVRADWTSSIRIASWVKKYDVLLPVGNLALPKRQRDLLERTYATAAYAIFDDLARRFTERITR